MGATLDKNEGRFPAPPNSPSGQIINIRQQNSDPEKPSEGKGIIWLSDGAGIGNPGDLMIASTIDGETRYNRLFDYNNSYPWF